MLDTEAGIPDAVPASIADGLLTALTDRVANVVSHARAEIASIHDAHLAAGAAEVVAVTTFETIVRIAQGLQHDAVAALEERRSAIDPDHDTLGNQRRSRSLRAEVGMARGVGNGAGQHALDVAVALRAHPLTHSLLRDGAISAGVAAAVCGETASLDRRRRSRVDELVAASLPGMSPREASAAARRHVLALDAEGAAARAEAARATRHLRLRRLPDAMAELTVRAPAEQVISAWRGIQTDAFALKSAARDTAEGDTAAGDTAAGDTAAGDDTSPRVMSARTRAARQLAADLAIERLTGVPVDTADGSSTHMPAEIGLLMRPETLFGSEDTPGVLDGYGPVPAALCRRLAGREATWLRRLFTDDRGDPRDADERRRRFPARLARLIRATDGQCLRPYCDCDITEIDHVVGHSSGGPTTDVNGQGLCGHDNLVKEAPGWKVRASVTDGNAASLPDTITWTTPTGHGYTARRHHRDGHGPTLIAYRRPRGELSPVETHLHDLIRAHRPDRR